MVFTRKPRPKKPLTYSTGGAVPMPDPPPAPEAETDDALAQSLRAQQHAEELARVKPPSIEDQIDAIPGISDANRQWLKKYPRLIDPGVAPLAQRAYQIGLAEGFEADSDEMREHITREVSADLERLEKARTGALRFDPQPEPEPEPAYQPPPPPTVAASRPVPPPASPSPARRSVPVSAPVSREVPTSSGRRESPNQMTLTAEERAIAHNSFGATAGGVQMSNAEKERLYAMNKLKYQRMLASGEYSRQGDR
ncbi:hypothetical protein ACQR1Y_12475 [Bradyrhizobium sp. HKCCYLRH3099]